MRYPPPPNLSEYKTILQAAKIIVKQENNRAAKEEHEKYKREFEYLTNAVIILKE